MKKVLISSLIIAFIMITALIVIIFHNKNSDVHEDKMALIATKAKKIARVTGPTLEGETIPNPNQTHEKWACVQQI